MWDARTSLSASYYAHVDYRWLQETLLASHPGLAAFARGAPMPVDKFTVIGPAIASAALGSVFEWLAVALYVVFLGALVKRARPFKLALAIAAWVRVPFIVAMIPSSINVAIHPDGRLLPGQIDPATFAGLVGMPHDPFWQSLAQGVSLDYLWACALLVICLRHALAMSRWKALASVVAPATFIKLIAALAMTSALAS